MVLWLAPSRSCLLRGATFAAKILAAAGLRFEIRPSQIDERAVEVESGIADAAAVARHLARAKAQAVASSLPGRLVLVPIKRLHAGQNVLPSRPIVHGSRRAVARIAPAGVHELHSALALVRDNEIMFARVDTARLAMRDFSDRFLNGYLDMAGNAATRSVGGYQLEGIGIHLFERVEGDFLRFSAYRFCRCLAFLRQDKFVDV